MGRLFVIAGLAAVALAGCDRSQLVPRDTAPAPPFSASQAEGPPPSPDDPPATGSVAQAAAPVAQASTSQVACSQQQAAEIVRVQHTLQASNDPCVIYWRSMDVRQHPERAYYLECSGLKAYPDPQPRGHPVSLAECDRKLRERQGRMGVPVTGMTEEQKVTYRATWGN
jgi:hypothetical protein